MSALLQKAWRALGSAKLLLSAGDRDGAVNRAYYAMFDAAKAALTEGDEPIISQPIKSHNGLITLFSQNLVLDYFYTRNYLAETRLERQEVQNWYWGNSNNQSLWFSGESGA
jgi:uncharacterized protein (UPF0332 family)